jgi:hypothetical protein
MINFDKYWDEPVYGAASIAEILNLLDANGKPDLTRAYHVLESGYVDADKMGRRWWSTRRRLLKPEKASC